MKKIRNYSGRYTGKWWLPGQDENLLHGALEINSDGEIHLSLFGSFNSSLSMLETEKLSQVYGIASSEKDNKEHSITLYDLIETNKTLGNLTKSRYFAHKALIGNSSEKHATHFDEVMLSSITFSNWVEETGLGTNITIEDDNVKTSSVSYTQPDLIELYSGTNYSMYIFFRWSYDMLVRRSICISEQPYLSVKFKNTLSLRDLLREVRVLELFFMVLWEQYHIFIDVDIADKNKGVVRLLGSRYTQSITEVEGVDYTLFKSSAKKYINNWLKIYDYFNLSIRTFFFSFADYKVDIHSRFLNYVFALEQLHRKGFRASEPLSRSDKKMYEKAMQIKQGDLKSWLERVLNEERDIRIATRLQELCDFSDLEGSKQISKDEIDRIKNMRHYLVHLDEKHKKSAFSAREVFQINYKLESLFFGVLKKMMVDEKPCPKLIIQSQD